MCVIFVLGVVVSSASPLRVPASTIPPANAQNITVYHLNPKSAGALPVNMDTGDARGDLYFYLGEFLLPLECANATAHTRAQFDCDNPERVDKNLVVTKVNLQVDSRLTSYSACNLCNGKDPFTGRTCTLGTYICDCESRHHGGGGSCDATKVGAQNITDHFVPVEPTAKCTAAMASACGSQSPADPDKCYSCLKHNFLKLLQAGCSMHSLQQLCPSSESCSSTGPAWHCYLQNIPRKTGGFWYSTLAEGQCTSSSKGSCGWAAQSLTTIKEECLKDHLMTSVEAFDTTGCFHGCGVRNTTSPCWIGCFFDTILGENGGKSISLPLGGMPMSAIEKSWAGAFLPKEQGGCDTVSM